MTDKRSFDFKRHLPSLTFVVVAVLLIGVAAGATVYAGVYDIGADAPHATPTSWAIQQLRDRSIAVRARTIAPPADLGAPERVATGAGLYAEMCSSCHLGPGLEKTEISQGLCPQAPDLSRPSGRTPSEQFWIIKHGVKMTAMPAWGRTHDDALIWDMVAFVRQLPRTAPQQYQAAIKDAPADHDATMRDMPGMAGAPTEHGEPGHKH